MNQIFHSQAESSALDDERATQVRQVSSGVLLDSQIPEGNNISPQLQPPEADSTPGNLNISPVHLGFEIRGQGDQLMEVLQMFRQSTSSPLAASILTTPLLKLLLRGAKDEVVLGQHDKKRKSPRLSAKSDKGKSVLKLAQDLVAKKCGLPQSDDPQEDMTLQQYLNMFKEPSSN
jgi:hypothetical protein